MSTPATAVPLAFALQDDGFHWAVMAINIHSRLHTDEVQRAIGEVYTKVGVEEIPWEDMDKKLGPRLVYTLRSHASEVFRLVDKAVVSHERFLSEVVPLLKKALPNGSFIGARSPRVYDPPLTGITTV